MDGLMMKGSLTIPAILRRAETVFAHKTIVTRRPDRSLHRCTYADLGRRARQLAVALEGLGVEPGDRVATLGWNHHQHLEAYYGVPMAGAVLHTLNLRLQAADLTYIINHAGDRVLLVDQDLLPLYEQIRADVHPAHVVVVEADGPPPDGLLEYEALIGAADPAACTPRVDDEQQAAAMCYTTGTTGRPKGVLYSHRAVFLHAMAGLAVDTLGISEGDVALPVVPMFHANAWGIPYSAAMAGATQVLPGPYLDPRNLLELVQGERVTVAFGVPTVWLALLQMLDAHADEWDVSSVRMLLVGGSAAPPSMIQAFEERHGLTVMHAWGMTETSPLGTVAQVPSELATAPADVQLAVRAKQGRPAPGIEIRARGADGLAPWDGKSLGELEVCGPWVAADYFNHAGEGHAFTEDGWFRTGDIVTIDERGYIEIHDRAKDLIKSGGEWISSVAIENALMGHPDIAEAAVIAVPHPRWVERPLAVIVARPGRHPSAEDLRAYLAAKYERWMIPDAFEFLPELPRTGTGKFLKSALRARFKDYTFPDQEG
jgi:fatty-acyl-CoA synthase